MGKNRARSIARAVPGLGWRIWNSKTQRWWGEVYADLPEALLEELNGLKRPEALEQQDRTFRRNVAPNPP